MQIVKQTSRLDCFLFKKKQQVQTQGFLQGFLLLQNFKQLQICVSERDISYQNSLCMFRLFWRLVIEDKMIRVERIIKGIFHAFNIKKKTTTVHLFLKEKSIIMLRFIGVKWRFLRFISMQLCANLDALPEGWQPEWILCHFLWPKARLVSKF